MRTIQLSILLLTLLLLPSIVKAATQTNDGQDRQDEDPNVVVDQPGFKLTTTVTDIEGNPVSDVLVPYNVESKPGDTNRANEITFDISQLSDGIKFLPANGGKVRIVGADRGGAPDTMRNVRLNNYKTDGVFFTGQMAKQLDARMQRRFLKHCQLETVLSGENFDSFAQRVNVTASDLVLMNPLIDPEKIRPEIQLCVDSIHRVLPGETLSFLANLYQTTPEILLALNELQAGENIDWKPLRVPVVMENGRQGLALYRVSYDPKDKTSALDETSYSTNSYVVKPNDSYQSIAKSFGLTTAQLLIMNRVDSQSPILEPGSALVIESTIQLNESASLESIVKQLELKRFAMLEDVLALNGINKAEQIKAGTTLRIPAPLQ